MPRTRVPVDRGSPTRGNGSDPSVWVTGEDGIYPMTFLILELSCRKTTDSKKSFLNGERERDRPFSFGKSAVLYRFIYFLQCLVFVKRSNSFMNYINHMPFLEEQHQSKNNRPLNTNTKSQQNTIIVKIDTIYNCCYCF